MLSLLRSLILSFGLWVVMSLTVSAGAIGEPGSPAPANECELSDNELHTGAILFTGIDGNTPLGQLPRSEYGTSHLQLGKILTACRHFPSFCRKIALALIEYRIKIASQTTGRLNAADYYVFTLRRIII